MSLYARYQPFGLGGGGGGGITSINADTSTAQIIAAASTGTDFTISTLTGTTTIAIPSASATARGLITTAAQTIAGIKTFSSAPNFSSLSASLPLKLDGSKNVTAAAISLSSSTEVINTLPINRGGTGLTSTSQNFAFIGPTSGSGAPSWRALVSGDIPSLTGTYAAIALSNLGTTAINADLNFNKSSGLIQGRAASTGDTIRVKGGTGTVGSGGDAFLTGGNSAGGGVDGGKITAWGGTGAAGGGPVSMLGGDGGTSAAGGGTATVQGGQGNSAAGGAVSILGGTGGNFAVGGDVNITGGNSGGGGNPSGGNVVITPGTGSGGTNGFINFVTGSTTGAQAATILNSPVAGNATGWLRIKINGTTSYIPYWQ